MSLSRRTLLQRGGPLRRGKGLVSRTPLVRRTPLAASSSTAAGAKPKAPKRTRMAVDVRAVVAARSGGWCEIALPYCMGVATEMHHRVSRKSGGRHGAARQRNDRPANLLYLDPVCHAWITTRPAVAAQHGWIVREHQDPAQVAVWYRQQGLRWLDDTGDVHDYEAGAA